MIRKLIHYRAKSTNLICEQCFNKEYLLFKTKENIIKQRLSENTHSSFFAFHDKIEQMNKKKIMQKVINREQLTRNASHLNISPISIRSSFINKNVDNSKDKDSYAKTYKSLITYYQTSLIREHSLQSQSIKKQQAIIDDNKELMKQKTKEIINQSIKHSIWKTQMKEVHNANKEIIIRKLNSSKHFRQHELMRDKEIIDSINAAIKSKKHLYQKSRNIPGESGLNEELKRNIQEEINVICSHGQNMLKCSICNKLVPKSTMKFNIFIDANKILV